MFEIKKSRFRKISPSIEIQNVRPRAADEDYQITKKKKNTCVCVPKSEQGLFDDVS